MKNLLIVSLAATGIFLLPPAEAACGTQSVSVLSGKTEIAHWDVVENDMHRITLPNGFPLGLAMASATDAENERIAKDMRSQEPMQWVKISLFDMRNGTPRQLAQTWGGANSYQGYGPRGGADRVTEIGEPGVLLKLSKPACGA